MLAGIILLSFGVSFFSNLLGAILSSDLLDGLAFSRKRKISSRSDEMEEEEEGAATKRSLEMDQVAHVAEQIYQAYQTYNQ